MKYNPYSFTRMSMFKQCKRKFKYRYIDKIKDTEKSYHLEKGKYCHEVLENVHTGIRVDKSKYELSEDQYADIDAMLCKFLSSDFSTNFIKDINSYNEAQFGIDMYLNVADYDYRDKGLLYLGSVDRINFYDNYLHLIDWKTGKVKEQSEQLRHYALWALTEFSHIDKVLVSYVFIEHNQAFSEVITRDDVKNIKKELLYSIKDIESEKNFNKNETPLCDYCEYGPNKLRTCDL